MTITEFLLARIGEDEDVAHHGDGGILEADAVDVWFNKSRVLAECETKRRIVDECSNAAEWAASPDCDAPLSYATLAGTLLGVLRTLATVYADHPDYDEAWRA